MKFYEALKEMQAGKRCKPRASALIYHWGDVFDIPCLKDSDGREVMVNSWLMNAEWVVVEEPKKLVTKYPVLAKDEFNVYHVDWELYANEDKAKKVYEDSRMTFVRLLTDRGVEVDE